jgi:DNA-binding LacI/PurR family transcriptional regulator
VSTIKEVAELAGVSIGTVSHVLGGAVRVSEPLRKKVQAAIRTLDFHPNHIARSLKTTKSRTLGIIVPDITIPFFSHVIRSAEEAARRNGYWVVAVNSDDDAIRQKEILSLFRSQRVEGVLLAIASGPGSRAQIHRLLEAGTPVVCLDRLPDRLEVDSVCVEGVGAAEMGVAHLISLGHRRIAIVTGPLTLKNERERLRGYKLALERAGIDFSEALLWEGDLRQDDVLRLCKKHLGGTGRRPTALFCTNGVTGLGALRAMAECDLSTPEDLAFVTFDELTPHDLFRPGITSVVQPAHEIGYTAAEILIERIRDGSTRGPRIEIRLPATLKIRESSSMPRHPHLTAIRAESRTG